MSHTLNKLASVIKKARHKSSESASRRSSRSVGDSVQTTLMDHKTTTNKQATSTFTGLILTLASALTVLVLPVFLGASDTYATASSITVTITSGDSPSNPIVTKIPPTPGGKFVASDATELEVITDHAAGYTLTTTATDLSFTENGDTYTINTLPAGTTIDAATFGDITSSTYNNKWGYLPSKYRSNNTTIDNTTNEYYLPAPTSGQVLDITDGGTSGNTYTVSIGARVDHTITQGFYKTDFTFAAVGNATPYTVTYNANDGAGGADTTNMPTDHTALDTGATGETVTLSTTTPERTTAGYIFKAWCTNASTDCSTGTIYASGGTFTLDQTSSVTSGDNTLNLYAIWTADPCYNETNLYNLVACQVKKDSSGNERTQTLADMQAVITEPTSTSPLADTSNSGVYKYDAAYFGIANDNPNSALNTEDIYYFRGILDSTFAESDSYGGIPSSGNSGYYQNYVRLSDTAGGKASTCWRIIRTTASGGVKMIYNGTWSGATCARAGSHTGAGSTYYNRGTPTTSDNNHYGTLGFVTYAGYNYNSTYAYDNTQYTSHIPNSELFNNETPSNLRIKTEEWYANSSNLSAYQTNGKLETSAGWCNDRATTSGGSSTGSETKPYGGWVAFSVYSRNASSKIAPTLTCSNAIDLLSASNGLSYPVAHLTMDEASLTGHGYRYGEDASMSPEVIAPHASNFSYLSFLRSGAPFWLISPSYRDNVTPAIAISTLTERGCSARYMTVGAYRNFRPIVSLASSTAIGSGSGTSTDPWVVEP